jgi:RNA polymerase sigma-70 factor (ECF subfamily)
MQGASDRNLLEHWRAGDRTACETLLARHCGPLLRYFKRRAGSEADDLLQRTLVSCLESVMRLRDEATFRTYLFTIARHELYRFYRRRAARMAQLTLDDYDPPAQGASAEADLLQRERERALKQALTRCSEAERELLRLFYESNLDSRTLSLRLGIEPSSVRARLYRSRAELRRALTD